MMSWVPLAVGLSKNGALSFWSRTVTTKVTDAVVLLEVAETSTVNVCGAGILW